MFCTISDCFKCGRLESLRDVFQFITLVKVNNDYFIVSCRNVGVEKFFVNVGMKSIGYFEKCEKTFLFVPVSKLAKRNR